MCDDDRAFFGGPLPTPEELAAWGDPKDVDWSIPDSAAPKNAADLEMQSLAEAAPTAETPAIIFATRRLDGAQSYLRIEFDLRETYLLYTDERGYVHRVNYPDGWYLQRPGGW